MKGWPQYILSSGSFNICYDYLTIKYLTLISSKKLQLLFFENHVALVFVILYWRPAKEML